MWTPGEGWWSARPSPWRRLAFSGSSGWFAIAGERGRDRAGQGADGEGLAQQLVATQIVRLSLADVAGHEEHREIARTGRFQIADQLGAAHFRHDDVGDDEVKGLCIEEHDRLRPAGTGDRFVIEILEGADGCRTHSRIVLDQ